MFKVESFPLGKGKGEGTMKYSCSLALFSMFSLIALLVFLGKCGNELGEGMKILIILVAVFLMVVMLVSCGWGDDK